MAPADLRAVPRRAHAVLTRPLDRAGRGAAVVWRSVFVTAAALCVVAGVLHAFGRRDSAYSLVLVAGALGAVGTLLGLLALRVEPDPSDPETQP